MSVGLKMLWYIYIIFYFCVPFPKSVYNAFITHFSTSLILLIANKICISLVEKKRKEEIFKYFTLILFVCPLNLLEAGRHFVLPALTMAVSPLNDSTLNGLVKTLEMAVKPYKTAPPNKLGPLFFSHHPASPSRWPHRRAECCVQPLESRLLLVPHRRSGGGPLQTARVGLRGGGGGCGWRGDGEG